MPCVYMGLKKEQKYDILPFCGMTGTSDVQVHSYTFVDDSCLSVIKSATFEDS